MNPFFARLVLTGLYLSASAGAASADNFLIVPGRSIGQTTLGPNGTAQLRSLPRPDAEDSAMMQSYLIWVSRTAGHADTLFIHTTRNAALEVRPLSGETIDTIRITSRRFHTRSGISTGSTLAEVRRRFPSALLDKFNPGIYVDARLGISFEFTRPVMPASHCIGISIYPPSSDFGSAETDQSEVDDILKNSRT